MKKGHYSVHISPDVRLQLKRKAVNEDTTMKKLVDEAIKKSLAPKHEVGY